MPKIHQTAIVDPKAKIADDVEIGPYCIVGPDVTIGAGSKLIAHCYVGGYTVMGTNNAVYPFACIGTNPQDYNFKGGVSYTNIGNNNFIREYVTIQPGTQPETVTTVGSNCLFMANSHIAHNCVIGDRVILVNCATLGGYVNIGNNCLISAQTGIHQFCRVGRFAVLSGCSAISMDLPPFMICSGRNGAILGINIVGFRRNGFSKETIEAIRDVYQIFFRGKLTIPNAIEKIKSDVPDLPEVREFIEFVQTSKRGVLRFGDIGDLDPEKNG
ncbi:MAG: acyl-ACP--UDP-N-acetylglucosamine O-acyltransferase [Victivallales bacterium]